MKEKQSKKGLWILITLLFGFLFCWGAFEVNDHWAAYAFALVFVVGVAGWAWAMLSSLETEPLWTYIVVNSIIAEHESDENWKAFVGLTFLAEQGASSDICWVVSLPEIIKTLESCDKESAAKYWRDYYEEKGEWSSCIFFVKKNCTEVEC